MIGAVAFHVSVLLQSCLIDLIRSNWSNSWPCDFAASLYLWEDTKFCSSSAYIMCRRREEKYFCQPWGLATILKLLLICNLWHCMKCSCLQVENNEFPLLIPVSSQLILNGMDSSESFSSVLFSSFLHCTDLHGSFSLTLTIGNDFLPDIKLLVYTLFLDGQVVADVEEFQVAKCFRHKVSRNAKWKKRAITSLIFSGLLSFLVLFYL